MIIEANLLSNIKLSILKFKKSSNESFNDQSGINSTGGSIIDGGYDILFNDDFSNKIDL